MSIIILWFYVRPTEYVESENIAEVVQEVTSSQARVVSIFLTLYHEQN